jgi:acetoin utilization protein AcuB
MRVSELMTKRVHSVPPDLPAADAWELMIRKRIRHLVVMNGAEIVGVVSDRDLGGRSGQTIRTQHTVADLMTKKVVSVEPAETIRAAANLMRGRTIGCLPVVDKGRLVGIVTTADLLALLGRGIDRPATAARAGTHYRVAHRKQHQAPRSW